MTALSSIYIWNSHKRNIEFELQKAADTSKLAASLSNRIFEGVDVSLDYFVHNLGSNPDWDKISNARIEWQKLKNLFLSLPNAKKNNTQPSPSTNSIFTSAPDLQRFVLADSTGKLRFITDKFPPKPVSLAKRDYFVYHKENSTDLPWIGKPIIGKISGQFVFTMTRRIESADKSFKGIAIANISLEGISNLLGNIKTGIDQRRILLIRQKNEIFSTSPFNKDLIFKREPLSDFFNKSSETTSGELVNKQGNTRLVGYTYLPRYDVSVLVDLSKQRVNNELRADIWQAFIFLLMATAIGLFVLLRRRAVTTLHAANNRLRDIVETTSDWIWELDTQANFLYASPGVKQILGYEPEELIGKMTRFDLMPPEEANKIRAEYDSFVTVAEPFDAIVNVNIHKDGHEVIMESSGRPFFYTDGKLHGYRGIDRDITERIQIVKVLQQAKEKDEKTIKEKESVQQQLMDSLELNKKILNTTNMGVIVYRADTGQCVTTNPAASQIVGATQEQVLAQNFRKIVSWQRSGLLELAEKTLSTGEDQQSEVNMVSTFEKNMWLNSFFSSFISQDKKHLLLIIADITSRKRLNSPYSWQKRMPRLLIRLKVNS